MTRLFIAAVAVVFAIVTVGTALTQVRPGELGVVRRWGRILPDHPGPGLHVGLPWGIDRVDRVPIGSVRQVIVGFREDAGDAGGTPDGQLLTGDHNLVNVQAKIDYVVRADRVDDYALLADRADALVARAAESALAEWIAGRKIDQALLAGKALLPSKLVADVNERLKEYKLGVRVEQVSLKLNAPDEVSAAFEAVGKASSEQETQINQAKSRAHRTLELALTEKDKIERDATTEAADQIRRAESEANAFLARLEHYRSVVKKQPDYINVLWQDEIARLFARLRETGHVDLLDNRLGADGINITQFPQQKK